MALLQKATGVAPAGERAVYPKALDEISNLPGAVDELRKRVESLERQAGS